MLLKKYRHRLAIMLSGASFKILSSFSTLIISLFIVRTQSPVLWGEVVYYLVLLDLGFAVVNWGHAPYLSREFSLHPSRMAAQFRGSVLSRVYLLVVFCGVILLMPFDVHYKTILVVWITARFLYQAFDPVVQYHRWFFYSVATELTGLVIVVVPIVLRWVAASPDHLIMLFSVSFTVKSVLVLLRYRFIFQSGTVRSWPGVNEFLKPAFPFFLLAVSAMLQQRVDIFIVAFFLDASDVAQYQVFLSFLFLGQLGASLLLSPFAKNIFRLPTSAVRKLERKFVASGLLLSGLLMVAAYLTMRYIYGFDLSIYMYLIGYFYSVAFYGYLIRNYEFSKLYMQGTVAIYSFAGFAVSLVVSLLLTPIWHKEGALLAALVSQLSVALLYFIKPFSKKIHALR